MEKFAYASPTADKDALALLGSTWGDTAILAGGTRVGNRMHSCSQPASQGARGTGQSDLAG